MGSDIGVKRSTPNMKVLELRRIGLAFTIGVLISGLFFYCLLHHPTTTPVVTTTTTTTDFDSRSTTAGTSHSCQISFGTYRGQEYSHEVQTKSSKCLVESKFLKLQQHSVQLDVHEPVISDWLWIDYHDRINVLVEAKTNEFWVFRQSKYALENRPSWAIVGGIIEPNELAKDAAQREVWEEMKLSCDTYQPLGRYRTDVNRGMGWTHPFLARHCHPIDSSSLIPQQQNQQDRDDNEVGGNDTERQVLHQLSFDQIKAALLNGEFLEIQWSATVALAVIQYTYEPR